MNEEIRRSIQAFQNRPIFTALDPATLAGIEDERLEQAIIDFVVERAQARELDMADALADLHPAFSHVFATWTVEAEVFNGGFNQFFFNSSGLLAERAAGGYAAIGAPQHEGIVREAIRRRDEHAPALASAWSERTLEAFSASYELDVFEGLDAAFYALDGAEDAARLRVAYIRAHPEALTAG